MSLKSFYFDLLDSEGQEIYRTALKTITKGITHFTLPAHTDFDTIMEALIALDRDRPDLFCVNLKWVRAADDPWQTDVLLSYSFPGRTAEIKEAVAGKISEILRKMKEEAGECSLSQVRFLHNWLVRNSRYLAREDALDANPAQALLRNEAVCEGFSKAFVLLARAAGLDAMLVAGESGLPGAGKKAGDSFENEAGHSWNVVLVDGEYVHLDITWDLCLSQAGSVIRYDYFCLPEAAISRDHLNFQAPQAERENLTFFRQHGLLFENEDSLKQYLHSLSAGKPAYFQVSESFGRKLRKKYQNENEFLDSCLEQMPKGRYSIISNLPQNIWLLDSV